MSAAAIIELLEALLKILPEVVSAIENIHAAVSKQTAEVPVAAPSAAAESPQAVDHKK